MESGDRNLLERLRGGDHVAFEVLYGRHKDRLYRHALAHTGGRSAVAEEVVQDVFLSLFQGSVAPKGHLGAYLLAAVRNRSLNAVRRREDRSTSLGEEGARLLVAGAQGPEGSARQREEAELLSAALLDLPPEQREVVLLRTFEGLAWKDVAQLAGAPVPTVSSRYRAALATLRTRCRSLSHA